MKNKDKKYYLAGKLFSEKGLIAYCRKRISGNAVKDFEKEICRFILDWFSVSDHLTVKTSGSTGRPKEILLEKKYMEASARSTISFFGLEPGNTLLHCLPMRFIAGKMMLVRALVGGLDLYYVEPSARPELIPEQIDFAAMVPLQLSKLMGDEKSRRGLSQIKKLIIGGSFIPSDLIGRLQNISTQVWQTYGMTETITHIALRKINGKDKSGWYATLPGVSVKPDSRGCLLINADYIGVSNLITNDLVEMNKKGDFIIKGRVDNIINSGGIKFNPEEIERKLATAITNDYFIGGIHDPELGQKLVLVIEDEGALKQTVFDLWEMMEVKLAKREIPKEIFFVPSLSRTPSGKINRLATLANVAI